MSTWIWYFGDFEIRQHLLLSSRREEKGKFYPLVWSVSDCNKNVYFSREAEITETETVRVYAEGRARINIDGKFYFPGEEVVLEKGKHFIGVNVINTDGLPAIFVEGNVFKSDKNWSCAIAGHKPYPAGCWNLNSLDNPPSRFELPVKEIEPAKVEKTDYGYFIDFGKETFIKLKLTDCENGTYRLTYGESETEANDLKDAIISECIEISGDIIRPVRCCRYVRIDTECKIGHISGLYEYLPLERKSSFKCNSPMINDIYETALYTLELTSREMFIDGIKRDRWVWSGDAYQSYLMDYYSYFDKEIIKRTVLALRGNDPILHHVNTIMDYSFYWIISIGEYYKFTGDIEFLKQIYPKMVTMADFCLSRCRDGLAYGRVEDWIFIDWADMEKNGALCAEQMLLCVALKALATVSELVGESGEKYLKLYKELHAKIDKLYWNEEKGGYVTTFEDGVPSTQIRRHQNIFAILFGFANKDKTDKIVKNVLLNDEIPQITTPYFKFYELEALLKVGVYEPVTKMLDSYWGGMLRLGATSFWEEYDPTLSGDKHWEMYGEPYGKSLCHAWGASPLYLLGRYYMGVEPAVDGYTEFIARPKLGGLEYFECTVPTNNGSVYMNLTKDMCKIKSTGVKGKLCLGDSTYEIEEGKEYTFNY